MIIRGFGEVTKGFSFRGDLGRELRFYLTLLSDPDLMTPQLRAAGIYWLTFLLYFGSPGSLVKGANFPQA